MPKKTEMPRRSARSQGPKRGIRRQVRARGGATTDVDEKPERTPIPQNQKNSLDVPNALVLRQTLTGFEGKLEISNVSYPFENHYMCYRVRSSAPDRYRISNSMGCIESGVRVNIAIFTEPKLKDEITFDQIKDDFFEIEAAPMPIKTATQSSLYSFWKKNAEGKTVERYRIEHILLLGMVGANQAYSALSAVHELALSDTEMKDRALNVNATNSLEKIPALEDLEPLKRLAEWMKLVVDEDPAKAPNGKRETCSLIFCLIIFVFLCVGILAQYLLKPF